jgi:hypothetical protein
MSTTISTRNFGKTNDKVGSIGLRAMVMAAFYGELVDQVTVDSSLNDYLSQGVTMIDTADVRLYSPPSHRSWYLTNSKLPSTWQAVRIHARRRSSVPSPSIALTEKGAWSS